MSKDIARSMVGVAILFGAMFVGFDRIAMAELALNQNTNPSPATQNSNATPQRKTKRTPAKPATPPATADPSVPAPNVTTQTPAAETVPTTPAQKTAPQTPAGEANRAQMLAAEKTDLSGTYTGTFVCDAAGINGDTTLTINGNEFTTADGKSGRIVATTTRGYTAVVLQLNDATGAAAATTPTIISLRARKSKNRLTLLPVSEGAGGCTFTPTATTAKSRRTRQAAPVPAATGTEVSNPAEAAPAVPDSAGPIPPSQPSPKSTRGKTKPKTSTPGAPKPVPTPPQP